MVKKEIYLLQDQTAYFLFDEHTEHEQYEYHVFVQAPVHVRVYCIILHAQRLGIDIYFHVQHAHANVQFCALYALSEKEAVHVRTFQNHTIGDAQSTVIIKGIVADQAQCDFYGSIDISTQGQGTQAYMEHKAIIMSPGARVSAQPTIQVLTHNVSCGHGSASGPFDQDQIYFLMARGFTQQQAQKIILHAFFEEILAQHPHKNSILARIEEKIL